jgi:multidrug efflux pump subunit AcrA (membrane-fusion protein)
MNTLYNVKTAGLMLLILLSLLLFVSRTIYIYRLPVVTGTMPFNGRLNKREISKGLAEYTKTAGLYSDYGGKVAAVYAKDGDMVEKGQTLLALSFDRDELEQSLRELETGFGYEKKQIEGEIIIAEQHFIRTEGLYNAGGIARLEYESAANALDVLKMKQDRLTDIFYIQRQAIEKKLTKLEGNEMVYAPESGRLADFNLKPGQTLGEHEYIGGIGFGSSFEIKCSLSIENNFTLPGDICRMKNANHSFDGIVTAIMISRDRKLVTVSVESAEIIPGETFDVTFEKESVESYTLVPNGALNMDRNGYFLYQIKRRDGILGKEFYSQKLRVYIGDSDDRNTAITKGISFFEPVSLYSSKTFKEGQTLYLSNEGDFFEK